ncbi:MAG: fumarylacetoacetate hydrolase family protein [Deltaproteobacteria bacterium]|nr:fumarylacetoacetate hydrolase family protein [Deltaproteobacteria bacterium]
MSKHTVQLQGRAEPVSVGKIVCIGRNYAAHIKELGNERPESPMFFIKPATSLCPLSEPVVIPPYSKSARHELELAALIGKTLKNCDEAQVLDAIDGWALALDVTLADVQERCKSKGHPWEIAKAFDGSCPISEFVPAASVTDPQNLMLSMRVNGEQRHHDSTSLMLWSIPELIAAASGYFTLEPGDIVLTGTPAGVGPLEPGDILEMEIEQVGRVSSSVAR